MSHNARKKTISFGVDLTRGTHRYGMSLDWATRAYVSTYGKAPPRKWSLSDETLMSIIPKETRKLLHMHGFGTDTLESRYPYGNATNALILNLLKNDLFLLFVLDTLSLKEGISLKDAVNIWTSNDGICNECRQTRYPFTICRFGGTETNGQVVCGDCQRKKYEKMYEISLQ